LRGEKRDMTDKKTKARERRNKGIRERSIAIGKAQCTMNNSTRYKDHPSTTTGVGGTNGRESKVAGFVFLVHHHHYFICGLGGSFFSGAKKK
jgi:hypothetical protein